MKPLAWLLIASLAPVFAAEKQASSRFVFFRPWAKSMQTHDPAIDARDENHDTARRPMQRYLPSHTAPVDLTKKNSNLAAGADRQLMRAGQNLPAR
jgi:hypothetical protein